MAPDFPPIATLADIAAIERTPLAARAVPTDTYAIWREAAARFGVNVRDVQDIIETAIGGKHITWTAGVSNTIAGDRAQTNGSRNTEFDTQFSYRVGIDRGELKKVQTQMFIRYADRYARSHDLVFGTTNLTRVKIFNAGLNITIF